MSDDSDPRIRAHQVAERHLPELVTFARRFQELADRMPQGVQLPPEDDLRFMTLCFLQRQADHLGSLIALVPHKDTILVTRSMVEGYCQLLWAAQEPEERAKRWRAFVWVAEWRQAKRLLEGGYGTDRHQAAMEKAENTIKKLGHLLLTEKGRDAVARGDALQDRHLYWNWRAGSSITAIIKGIEDQQFADLLYDPYSDWHHWGVWEIGQCIKWTPEKALFTSESPADSASALTIGIKSATRTMRFADELLNLGCSTDITALLDEFGHWIEANQELMGPGD